MKILIGTKNEKKFKEIENILSTFCTDVKCVAPESWVSPKEDGHTFRENAIIKAEFYFKEYGMPVIVEDSGLCVYALNGEPGIYSARYASSCGNSESNIDKLLKKLKDVPIPKRKAYFYCHAIYLDRDYTVEANGRVEGIILKERRGRSGFGYDPVFFFPPYGRTFAQLSTELKNRVSHRRRALLSLISKIKKRGICV